MGTEVLHPQGCLLRDARPIRRRRDSPASASRRVTILGRGKARKADDAVAARNPRRVRVRPPSATLTNVYAGTAFALSPSPRALPLPSFRRREVESPVEVDPSATIFLRRLLRLE